MKLSSLLTPQRVLSSMKSTTPWEALEELIDHLIRVTDVSEQTREALLEALKEREEQVSTGIGHGVAIPHAYCPRLSEVEAVMGRSAEGIDFEAPDNAPVNFVIMLLVPENQAQLHLQTLASVAGVFSKGEVRSELKEAEGSAQLYDILLHSETNPV